MSLQNLMPALQQQFGFSEFRPGQAECVSQLLAGQSSLAIFPTGSGKSLCYQFTALQLPHLTLVVSPLLALMKDQIDFLRSKGIAAASLDSSLSPSEYQQVIADIKQSRLKILMVSVERFKNERFRQMIQTVPISMLVVDEAHCISEWGHNFRPDYLKLPHYRDQLNIPTVLLLTATATGKVKRDMAQKFRIAPEHVVQTGFYRPNLTIRVLPVSNNDKPRTLTQFINEQAGGGIVYVTLQKQAEEIAGYLKQQGFKAQAYHAGLGNEVRQRIQQSFMSGDTPIIVATIAFGMGVDKSDIRFVVHYDLPKSIENFSQEIGRAGRDGESSQCITFANLDGLNTLENFVYGDTPSQWGIEKLIELIAQETNLGQWEMQAYTTSFETNIRLLTLKTLLVQLELLGVVESKFSYFSEYKLKFLREPEYIIAQFSGERAAFIQAIFNHSKRKKVWTDIDIDAITQHYGADRGRVVTALDYLQDKNLIELQTKGTVDVYAVNIDSLMEPSLATQLLAYFEDKELKEIARIKQLIRFFELDKCLSASLATYFDDTKAPQHCGHCSVCAGQVATLAQYEHFQPPSGADIKAWVIEFEHLMSKQLVERGIDSMVTLQQKALFLLGLTSPWFTRFKVRQLSGFAKCEQMRFEEVMKALTSF